MKQPDKVTGERVSEILGERRRLWRTITRKRNRLVEHCLRGWEIRILVMEGAVIKRRGMQRLEYLRQIVEDVGCYRHSNMKDIGSE